MGTGAFGRLVPTDRSERRVLDRLDLQDGALERRLEMGFCSEAPNELFAAAERAVELMGLRDDPTTPAPNDGNFGLRRPGLPLQVVLVSAADDESPGDPDDWYARLRALRSRYGVRLTALIAAEDCEAPSIPERIGLVFGALREPVLLLCDEPAGGPWAAVPNDEPLRSAFPLAAVPLDRDDDWAIDEVVDEFAVYVDGERIPQRTEAGELRWEALIGPGEVRFAPGHVPEERQQVAFEYLPACGT